MVFLLFHLFFAQIIPNATTLSQSFPNITILSP
jgi:hypothetical protein